VRGEGSNYERERPARCPCTPYASLLIMFLNLAPLTGRSAISFPS
jgi:hypothetical protein